MWERLLKYPWSLYSAGEVHLAWPWSVWLAASVTLLFAAWWFAGYRAASPVPRPERLAMALLRGLLLAVALLALSRPVLVVPIAASERPGLLVLVDESLSMTLADNDGVSRSARVEAALRAGAGGVADRLESRFDIRRHAFGAALRPLPAEDWPRFDAATSDLAGALMALANGPARTRPAAVVLASDGGSDTGGLDVALQALRARGVPVHVLGAGEPRVAPDAELLSLAVAERVFAGDSIEAALVIGATGMSGRRARLSLAVDGDERVQRDIDLPADGHQLRILLPLDMPDPGLVRVQARLAPLPGERLDTNNDASALVNVLAHAPPSLHYEEEPRFEVKFLRRAVSEDTAVSLVSLVRTADNKFYRLGVSADDELADGFPRDAAALFRFAVVVLGARAAAALDDTQQALLQRFVAERGGALVLLENARGSAVIEQLSPLPAGSANETPAVVRISAGPLAARHPLTRFLLATEDARARLGKLPPLTLVRRARSAKPGADALLWGEDDRGEPLVVLAVHRYGRGRVVALPVRDSWRWQMHADVGPLDQTHETFWRQMLRWLAREAPSPISIATSPAAPAPGAEIEIQVTMRDQAWEPLAVTPPRLRVTTPLGDQFDVDTQRSTTPGVYNGRFGADVAGLWEMRIADGVAEARVDATSHWLEVRAGGREFQHPALDETLLRRVADASGGSYRPIARSEELLDALQPTRSTRGSLQRLPLWDAPALYLLLIVLAVAEWSWRRWRRLP